MSIEISLSIIAISLLILIFVLVIAFFFFIRLILHLKTMSHLLESKTLSLVEGTTKIVNTTQMLVENVKTHVEQASPLFRSIGKVSQFMDNSPHRFNSEMHDNTMNVNFGAKKGKVEIGDWAEWIALGVVLIQRLRKQS